MWRLVIYFCDKIWRGISFKNRLESKMDILMRRVIRLEILDAIKRNDTKTVFALFDEYSALGGNSYISLLVEKYKQQKTRRKK